MADELSFAGDIRPLFRDSDVNSMSFAFDLASYENVRTHGCRSSGSADAASTTSVSGGSRSSMNRWSQRSAARS
jgi:hypothetical protein